MTVCGPVHTPDDLPYWVSRKVDEDDLTLYWTLSDEECAACLRRRGPENMIRFALQVCCLRSTGSQLRSYRDISTGILVHIARQLEVECPLFLGDGREATERENRKQAARMLGFVPYTTVTGQYLDHRMASELPSTTTFAAAFDYARCLLFERKVILPSRETLASRVESWKNTSEDRYFELLRSRIDESLTQRLDRFISRRQDGSQSLLSLLRNDSGGATSETILRRLDALEAIRHLELEKAGMHDLPPSFVRRVSLDVHRYTTWRFRNTAVERRYPLLLCHLWDLYRTRLDHVVRLHDAWMTDFERRARRRHEDLYRKRQKNFHGSVRRVLKVSESFLDAEVQQRPVKELWDDNAMQEHARTIADCREYLDGTESGLAQSMANAASHLQRHFPRFLTLPFMAQSGQSAIEAVRLMLNPVPGKEEELEKAILAALSPVWRRRFLSGSDRLESRLIPVALAVALKESVRGGSVWVENSYQHQHFRAELEHFVPETIPLLPTEPTGWLKAYAEGFREQGETVAARLDDNPFLRIQNGRLHSRREQADLSIPSVDRLAENLQQSLAKIRIERLLQQVAVDTGFYRAFGAPPEGTDPSIWRHTLLAAILAKGSNLGLSRMERSAHGISIPILRDLYQRALHVQSFTEANDLIINAQMTSPLAEIWGDGTRSSSDGQRFRAGKRTLPAAFHPRYFGYYDRAVSLYTHTSDQFTVFAVNAVACGEREAPYVLEGLLNQTSDLRPVQHSTDTHGYTDQVFALCRLLGFQFMPRLKALPRQQLFWPKGMAVPVPLQDLKFQFIDTGQIGQQWTHIRSLVSAMREGRIPVAAYLKRLQHNRESDPVARALGNLGQLEKTLYLLKYVDDADLRRQVRLMLNHGEQRHQLARHLFSYQQGEFQTGSVQEIMNRSSALSLLSNAVVYWNTRQIEKLAMSQPSSMATRQDLKHITPLMFRHIILNGLYDFSETNLGKESA